MTVLSTNRRRAYSHNAIFSFAGREFGVNMTKFSFSWAMAEKGRAQARRTYTVYPYRVEQSKLTVELIFRDVQELLDFWKFVTDYQQSAVTSADYQLRFKSGAIQAAKGGCDYGVALEGVPFSVKNTDIAPKMTLVMFIMKDNFDYEKIGASNMKGSEEQLVEKKVTPSNIKKDGEKSMAPKRTKKQEAVQQKVEKKLEDRPLWREASTY